MKAKIIRIKLNMTDNSGIVVPKGMTATYTAECADGVVVWYFNRSDLTKRRADMLRMSGDENTQYMERVKKAITIMVGMSKEEIRDKILADVRGLK